MLVLTKRGRAHIGVVRQDSMCYNKKQKLYIISLRYMYTLKHMHTCGP